MLTALVYVKGAGGVYRLAASLLVTPLSTEGGIC
jgi:hypothetical protein